MNYDNVKEKFLASVASKSGKAPDEQESESPTEETAESPMYDLACRLCDALGVSEDKADAVADVLMDIKSTE